tara:strand:+ start:270 stop:569 length:300 start_codon:yes stop_codon:yes gene_type:complete
MLLTEFEIAKLIGKPLTDLTQLGQKRQIRKLIRKAGINPLKFYVKGKQIWCIPHDSVRVIIQCQMNSKSLNGQIPRPGGFEEQSSGRRSMKAQEYLTAI